MWSVLARSLIACTAVAFIATGSDAQGKGREKAEERGDKGRKQAQASARPQKSENKQAARAGAVRDKGPPAAARKGLATARAAAGGNVERIDAPTANRGKSAKSRYSREIVFTEMRPFVRQFVNSGKDRDRIAGGALARAHARGVGDRVLLLVPDGNRLRINNGNVVLVDLDDDRARSVGRWDVHSLSDDNLKSGAPAFCRSGAGHPVWGRQWCLDKGFGLGNTNDVRWGYTNRLGDVEFRRESTSSILAREALIELLGETSFNRLALHAITLGLVDPLVGNWIGEPTGSRVLLLTSGGLPVAELVDLNRDNRVDRMLVALKRW